MAGIVLEGVRKRFGSTEVIHGVDIGVEPGEFCVFVGPSGCGKSTLLRMIAGLEEISAGRLSIDGEIVNDLEPYQRGTAMVFQTYALYPHMSVARNMGFGLRMNGVPRAEVDRRVDEAARILRIEDLLDRKPRALSGGQRQRVAIGRAIVREPRVFLFDEPLSNLDAELRVATRLEIAKLHRRLDGATVIYVTHDQVEAMTLADRIVVLRGGRVEQTGTPMDLYHRPANVFVAGFIGSPRMNLVRLDENGRLPDGTALPSRALRAPEARTLGVRADALVPTADPREAVLHGTVEVVERLGDADFAWLRTPWDEEIVVRFAGGAAPTPTTALHLAPAGTVHLFDENGRALEEAHATPAGAAPAEAAS